MRDGISCKEEEQMKRPRCDTQIARAVEYEKAKPAQIRKLEVLGVDTKDAPKGMNTHKNLNITMKDLEHFFEPMDNILAIKMYDEEVALQAAKDFMEWRSNRDTNT